MFIQPRQRENGESLKSYFEYFDNLVTCNNWNDNEAAAFFKIAQPPKDSVLSTISGFSEDKKKSYSAIRELLLDAQKPLRATTIIKLKEIKRRKGQSLDDFASVITRYVDLLYPNMDPKYKSTLIRDQFYAGLDSKIQSSLASSLHRLETLDEIKNQAQAFEAILNHQNVNNRSGGGKGDHRNQNNNNNNNNNNRGKQEETGNKNKTNNNPTVFERSRHGCGPKPPIKIIYVNNNKK